MSEAEKIAAGAWSDLPRSYEEIFKRSLDQRGRPAKSLDLPSLEVRAILQRFPTTESESLTEQAGNI